MGHGLEQQALFGLSRDQRRSPRAPLQEGVPLAQVQTRHLGGPVAAQAMLGQDGLHRLVKGRLALGKAGGSRTQEPGKQSQN